jgi:cellulose synthase/poly-beta-1,6-N-acetylglucosamine synthase-like glycosyltransferase
MSAGAPILLIGLNSDVAPDVIAPLRAGGYQVQLGTAADIKRRSWTAVISSPAAAGLGALDLLAALASSSHGATPLLVIGQAKDIAGLAHGANIRTLCHPFAATELLDLVGALLPASTAPGQGVSTEVDKFAKTLLTEDEFCDWLDRKRVTRMAERSSQPVFVASVRLHELESYLSRLAPGAINAIYQQQLELAQADAVANERYARGAGGELLVLFSTLKSRHANDRLRTLSHRIASHVFRLPGQQTTFTPIIGYARLTAREDAHSMLVKARAAASDAASRLDLQPALHRMAPVRRGPPPPSWLVRLLGAFSPGHRIWLQFGVSLLIGMGFPYVVYAGLGALGWDITHGVYVVVVSVLALTALSIWAEGLLALRPIHPPVEPARPYPSATAIIAAYLPNEAPIIEATIDAFLRVQYPASLQIILAYNTPTDLAIEDRLRQIAAAHPNFIPMRIQGSTSKAQNVNAALTYATGEFSAVFDADHQPDPDSFRRAWRWLSHGADVVQGHCLIRNGDASWVARMVAVEFEQIYAVNHPGRARLHGFGIFGGSNGYWKTDLLRQLRMHGFMLTEDIDSSLRAVIGGRTIVSDPYLISRELAPETMAALLKQRLRWAQGWFQISLKWALPALRSPRLNLQQKLGMLQLLVWREAFPWVSMQIVPLVAYWAVQAGSLWRLDWMVPIFVVTTLFTLSTGPGQILFTYHLAEAQIKQQRRWFWTYLWTSTLFYSGQKNAWNRIAHIKEAMGETTWNVTARSRVKK